VRTPAPYGVTLLPIVDHHQPVQLVKNAAAPIDLPAAACPNAADQLRSMLLLLLLLQRQVQFCC
jgi:hypothetical protein